MINNFNFRNDLFIDLEYKAFYQNDKLNIYHTFILGDCLDKLKSIEDNSIHLIITDPPYFLDGLDDKWNYNKIKEKVKKSKVINGLPVGMKFDVKQGRRFQDFYYRVSLELIRVLKPGGFFLSFSQPRLFHRMAIAVEDAGFEIRDQYAWSYRQSQMKAFSQNHFVDRMNISDEEKNIIKIKLEGRKTPQLKPHFESIMLAQKPRKGTFVKNWLDWEVGLIDANQKLNGKSPSTIMEMDKPKKDKYNNHLAVKPVMLLEHLIKVFSKENQIILDPFIGSGSTAIACQNSNRYCIGIEIDNNYLITAIKRINDIGGKYVIRY